MQSGNASGRRKACIFSHRIVIVLQVANIGQHEATVLGGNLLPNQMWLDSQPSTSSALDSNLLFMYRSYTSRLKERSVSFEVFPCIVLLRDGLAFTRVSWFIGLLSLGDAFSGTSSNFDASVQMRVVQANL